MTKGLLINESTVVKHNDLYFHDENLRVYQLDLRTGKRKDVFSLGDVESIKKYVGHGYLHPEIHFTKSYITADLLYDDSKRKFLVYSYDGELIREFSLPAF